MTTSNKPYQSLFDTRVKAMQRARAAMQAPEGSDFLIREVADRMNDRLQDINRDFRARLDLGNRMGWQAGAVPFPNIDMGLGLEATTHDLITSNLILHWVGDLPGVLVQINRALKPDGLMLASMFGGETLCELRQSLLAAETEIAGGAGMRVSPMVDVRDAGSLLQRAGFALPVADMDTLTVKYDHPLKLMHDLRNMAENNALQERSKQFLRRNVLMRACEIYQEKYAGEDGRIPATFQIVYLTGWHPDKSQQQSLKPGEGKINLADALGKAPPSKLKK